MHDYAIDNAQCEISVSEGCALAIFQAALCAWRSLIFM
jgi:hypothetical protein